MHGVAPPPRPKLLQNEGNGQKFPVSSQDKGESLESGGKLPPVQQEKGKVESSGHEAKYGGENHSTKLSNEIKDEDSKVGKGSGERSGKPEIFGGESGAGSHRDGGEKPLLGNSGKEGIGKHEGPRDGLSHGGGDIKQENPLDENPKEPPPRDGFGTQGSGEAKFGGVTLSDSKKGGGGENQENQHGDGQGKHNFKNGQQQPEAAGRPESNLVQPEERPGTGSSSSHGFLDGGGGARPLPKDGGGRHKFQDSNMRPGGSDKGSVRHCVEGGGGAGGKGGKKKDASSSGQVSFAV